MNAMKKPKSDAPAKPRKAKAKQPDTQGAVNTGYYDIIRTPVITEKSTMIGEQNKVVFRVATGANKEEIKAAVEALFGVKVAKVNTLNRKGKAKGFRGTNGKQSDTKRAIVTLTGDKGIDFAAGVR